MGEEVDTDVERRRNFRLYSWGIADDSKARWEGTQGPKTAENIAITLADVWAWLNATYGEGNWSKKHTSEIWLGRDIWEIHVQEAQYAPAEPVPGFVEEARAFLVTKAQANEIKAGELIYGDNTMERATATIIDTTGQEKRVVLKKNAEDVMEMEEYTPLITADTAKTA